MTAKQFRTYLRDDADLSLDVEKASSFDGPFLAYSRLQLVSLTVQMLACLCLLTAAWLHDASMRRPKKTVLGLSLRRLSQICVGCVAVLSIASVMIPLTPNYARLINVTQYCKACATHFDAILRLSANAMVGAGAAGLLASQAFSLLITLPVTAVRGVWWSAMQQDAELKEAAEERRDIVRHRRQKAVGRAVADDDREAARLKYMKKLHATTLLRALMYLLAITIPLVTVFPLLFLNQLAQDVSTRSRIVLFLTTPSACLILATAKEQHKESYFYPAWVTIYVVVFAYLFSRELNMLHETLKQLLMHADWAWAWSAMHVEFCVSNLIFTDFLGGLMASISVDKIPHDSQKAWVRMTVKLQARAQDTREKKEVRARCEERRLLKARKAEIRRLNAELRDQARKAAQLKKDQEEKDAAHGVVLGEYFVEIAKLKEKQQAKDPADAVVLGDRALEVEELNAALRDHINSV